MNHIYIHNRLYFFCLFFIKIFSDILIKIDFYSDVTQFSMSKTLPTNCE